MLSKSHEREDQNHKFFLPRLILILYPRRIYLSIICVVVPKRKLIINRYRQMNIFHGVLCMVTWTMSIQFQSSFSWSVFILDLDYFLHFSVTILILTFIFFPDESWSSGWSLCSCHPERSSERTGLPTHWKKAA